jgi:beta-galactosidase
MNAHNNIQFKKIVLLFFVVIITKYTFGQTQPSPREHLLMDYDWHFAFGHPYDTNKDFNNGTSYFSYFAKAGYGDGAADPRFDDRAWRKVNLPHDWAVEQPFSPKGSFSHGFKAIGRNFPDASVGWYRKTFFIPASDLGKHISIAFDGVFRNSIVWLNGHYLGNEQSGYSSFEYNISEYLNYGGPNVVAVRVDATMEEGWFYEGAGIYRHVWLNKTNQLHVARNGTFVTTKLKDNQAIILTHVTVNNDADTSVSNFSIKQIILDADGKIIAHVEEMPLSLNVLETKEFSCNIKIRNPKLWSIDTPYLHKLVTTIIKNHVIIDQYETTFGIRTIRFDANHGFFLNGKHLEITGADNHQDHAGVGVAMPDALQDFRIKAQKAFGCNAIRCSHNPPTPEFLDACDRLGMLVLDENRLMGVTDYHLNELKQMMLRDRNHPCIIAWSIGNEEWNMEGTVTGTRVATTMQAYAKTIDSSRYITAAYSGGIGSNGILTVMDLLGYNYVVNKNTDEQHQRFPNQLSWGTEEGATTASRGIYVDDLGKHQLAAYDRPRNSESFSIEQGWKHYAVRPYLAGMFIWTGFDYRGEPTPFGWPSVYSYHGMLDACGFPKDDVWYLKSWWMDADVVHVLPHWNWKGKEGQDIPVWVYSNSDEVELFLNKKSLGKKTMPRNGHLEWSVAYQPGKLQAIGYKAGKEVADDMVQTTSEPATLLATADRSVIKANKADISVIKVQVNDKNGLPVPTADNQIAFTIQGPGKIIGVGNGSQTSLEPEQYIEQVIPVNIENLKEKLVKNIENRPEVAANFDDADWQPAFKNIRFPETAKVVVYRGTIQMPNNIGDAALTLFYNNIGKTQSIYINGQFIQSNDSSNARKELKLTKSIIHPGKNSIAIITTPFVNKNSWDYSNTNPGTVQIIIPPAQWKRKLFNGLAQVIIQSTGEPGQITLTSTSPGLKENKLEITAAPAAMPAIVASVEK